MFAKLRGTVDDINEDSITLDVNGVGYHVYRSSRTLQALAANQAAQLIIETQVREESITLFGFPSNEEREWFRLLTTVQGVGAKMGMALMSAYPPGQIAQAIAAKDT